MTQFSQMGRRMIVVAILLLGLFAYILWQLYTVQIKRHEELYKKARMKYTTVKTMNGKRGEIYDYSGNLLVGNIPCSGNALLSEELVELAVTLSKEWHPNTALDLYSGDGRFLNGIF